ncbi:hypothetical protein Pcinc_031872 [Petrolisthes cinctipes]|uniref:Uncharacterized protein n=1 Tax=Petrolisthes cinctipes TaxID=88211 RepID=A0AAE1EVP5_PETCI|nr:hypothetical protein Pcinc_031872 [Petrolisthes cinctipes]
MTINTPELLSLLAQLCEEKNLQVTVTESMKGGVITGSTAFLGGLLGGPIGLAVGGTVGGLTAAYLSQGKFKSAASVIMNDLTIAQKERLCDSVRIIFASVGPEDAVLLASFALQPAVKERVLLEVYRFFESQLRMPITN